MEKKDGMNYAPKGKPSPWLALENFRLQPWRWITGISMECATV